MKEDRYRIAAIAQAGEVLKVVANSREAMGSSEIARLTGLTGNTAFRICFTLEELGFLTRVGDRYELGMGLALFWARKKAMLENQRMKIDSHLKSIHISEDADATKED